MTDPVVREVAVPELDELPDLDSIKARAFKRRDHFARIAAQAQAEIDKVDEYLARIGIAGPERAKVTGTREVSERTYVTVLTALSTHAYASTKTISSQTSVSTSHLSNVMRIAERNGHVIREIRGHRGPHRFILTDAGMEFLTTPVAQESKAD